MLASRSVRAVAVILWGIVIAAGVYWAAGAIRDHNETARTTARFDPPVWAGQNVPGACSGGFYARSVKTIVLTIVGHCATPGAALRDANGRLIGVFGPRAELAECPENRFCSPSDFLTLALAPDRIPWGHLNLVDMGAGGYRTIEAGTRPLACSDIKAGDRVEIDGRERYRTGTVIASVRYEYATDVIFPCMVVADIGVETGDSGGAVLDNGAPAGIISREIDGRLGFTPLAEGLDNLRLTLCTTPDCELAPESAVQPEP
jgi:hypothetical protein